MSETRENRLREAFRLVKVDVNSLWYANEQNRKKSEYLQARIEELEAIIHQLKGTRPKENILVGSKLSNKVHEDRCVFAKNIDPHNLIQFPTVKHAFAEGFHKCVCLS